MLLGLDSVFAYRVKMDSRMPIWKGHGKNMLSCILLTNSLKSSNSFVTDGSDGRYPKQLVIACYCLHQRKHTPAYARIRQFGNCWLSASKHSHETFCHQDAATVYIMNLLRESIASKLPEIIWSHTRCLQLKRSQRNCILALCRNGCELQLINREKARRQIVMQQRASSYLC